MLTNCSNFQTCFYCKSRGASIGCCVRQCKKSFHLPCAIQNRCTAEFIGNFQSFCHVHFGTNTQNSFRTHESTELCKICQEPMGEHNQVTSLQTVCCSTKEWYHKQCLKEQAFRLEDDFKCPCCGDVDAFRENMLYNGIYIPKSNTVAQYNSIVGDLDIEPPQKKRRVRKNWIHEKTFETKKEADQFLVDEN